jgi:hypothetical protein
LKNIIAENNIRNEAVWCCAADPGGGLSYRDRLRYFLFFFVLTEQFFKISRERQHDVFEDKQQKCKAHLLMGR